MIPKTLLAEKLSRLFSQIHHLEAFSGSLCIKVPDRPKIVSSLKTIALELSLLGYISEEHDVSLESIERALQAILDILARIELEIL